MTVSAAPPAAPRTPWLVVMAFVMVYVSWGTTFLAIKVGVRTLPPALFAGVRITLAGLLVLGYLAVRRERLWLSRTDLFWTALSSLFLFVGGNYLLTIAERSEAVETGFASVLTASAPIWMAVLELLWPWGERLTLRGWAGLGLGFGGVVLLLSPRLHDPAALLRDAGPLLLLGSAFLWSVGSFMLRYRRPACPNLLLAAWQMIIGGGSLTLIGLIGGETGRLTPESFTPAAMLAFLHLLVIGSLVGFIAYTYLLGRVSAALAGTYAYVNPVIAILVGWLIAGEPLSGWTVGGMFTILTGVALVRGGMVKVARPATAPAPEPTAGLELRPARCT